MRTVVTRRSLIAVAAALLLAGDAAAGALGWTGSLSLTLIGDPWGVADRPTVTMLGNGTAQVNGSGGGVDLTALFLTSAFGPVSMSLPVTSNASSLSVRFTGVRATSGSISGLGAPPAGKLMGLTGMMKICEIFDATCGYVFVALPAGSTAQPMGVPGTQVETFLAQTATAHHAAWTLGTPTVTYHQAISSVVTPTLPGGFVHGPASATSTAAQPSGTVQLITVTKVISNLSSIPDIPLYATLRIHFVPEPHGLLLMAAGMAVLVARRRGRPR